MRPLLQREDQTRINGPAKHVEVKQTVTETFYEELFGGLKVGKKRSARIKNTFKITTNWFEFNSKSLHHEVYKSNRQLFHMGQS